MEQGKRSQQHEAVFRGTTMTPQTCRNVTIMMVGDLILDEPNPDSFFETSRQTLLTADVAIGHVEVPHTNRGSENSTDVPAPPANPENLATLHRVGFHIATLAGNHIADSGPNGIEDTIATLRSIGILSTGAGMTLSQSREPAVLNSHGTRVGVLSYNCVGPRDSWATSKKAGCAYVKVLTHYELDHASPGGPPTIYTFPAPESLEQMEADIEQLKSKCDIAIVALHKGVGHTPAKIEMYERTVSKSAVDAGADVVIGHHAHIMRGIEIYKGKPIYHGLGNFVCVTRALSINENDSPERLAWAKRREKLFGFSPDPLMPTYPFHPESRNTAIAICKANSSGVLESGLIPCYIDQDARPTPLKRNEGGQSVIDYIEKISKAANFKTHFEWADDSWVRIRMDA